MLRRRTAVPALAALLLSTGLLAPANPSWAAPAARSSAARVADTSPNGSYVAVPAQRLLDTRIGTGGPTGPVPARGTIPVTVTGIDGIPSTGVAAVVANLTVAAPTANGYVTAYPDGTARPVSSNTNFTAGQTQAHAEVLVPGADGGVTLYNGSSGPTDLVLDVSGYYTAGSATAHGAFAALAPARFLDTRIGLGAPKSPVKAGGELTSNVTGRGGVPSTDVSAVLVDVIVTSPEAGGHISVPVPARQGGPQAETTVSFRAGQTVSGLQVAILDESGQLVLDNSSAGTVELVADVFGYYRGGTPNAAGLLGPLPAATLLDTGAGIGQSSRSAVAAHGTVALTVVGQDAIPAGTTAVALTVTVTGASVNGYVAVYASGAPPPATSAVNFTAGHNVTNLVLAPVGSDGRVVLSNHSAKPIDLIAAVDAYVGVFPGPLTWSTPRPGPSNLSVLSCASSSFCAAVEGTTNQVVRFDGSTWLAPQTVPGASSLTQLSCPSATFCLAIGTVSAGVGVGDVDAFAYRDGHWARASDPPVTNQPPIQFSATYNTLSCTSATFCMDLDEPDDNAYIFDGVHWTTSHNPLPTAPNEVDPFLSCASPTFCVALAATGQYGGPEYGARYDGATWTPTAAFSTDSADVTAISCPTSTFCGATTNTQASTFNGATWDEVNLLDDTGAGDAESVACPSAAWCVAVGFGYTYLFQNGAWTPLPDIDGVGAGGPSVISCPNTSFCAVVDGDTFVLGTASGR